MKRPSLLFLSCLIIGSLSYQSCSEASAKEEAKIPASLISSNTNNAFSQYWYQGKAEISSYQLEQSRYGENRSGDAVMVFVTEDFSKSKQVKLDAPGLAGDDKVPVLKLNLIKKFKTGIYDYSMMQSVFTPVQVDQYPQTIKTTMSSQEWCGQSFIQLNADNNNYMVSEFSYFESEGDKTHKIENVLLEDELWTKLRLDPTSIPIGNVEILPALFYSRLSHKEIQPKQARINIEKGEASSLLVLEYLHFNRTLSIRFESDFPHRILSWTEVDNNNITKGRLKKSIKDAYWNKNSNRFEVLRDSLQLTF